MTSNLMPSLIQIEKEKLKNLLTEVKETLATDITLTPQKKTIKFGIVDLWNCQKNIRTARSMRRY